MGCELWARSVRTGWRQHWLKAHSSKLIAHHRGATMITGLSHVSIAVPSLEAAARRLQDLYGLAVGETRVNEEQGIRLAYVELGNARIELMEPSRPDSSISKFLEHHPAGGIHHFCLNVD